MRLISRLRVCACCCCFQTAFTPPLARGAVLASAVPATRGCVLCFGVIFGLDSSGFGSDCTASSRGATAGDDSRGTGPAVYSLFSKLEPVDPCHLVSAREHVGHGQWRHQHGCPCPTRIPNSPEACPNVAMLVCVGRPLLWRGVGSRDERQLHGRFLRGGNEDRPADRQHETD